MSYHSGKALAMLTDVIRRVDGATSAGKEHAAGYSPLALESVNRCLGPLLPQGRTPYDYVTVSLNNNTPAKNSQILLDDMTHVLSTKTEPDGTTTYFKTIKPPNPEHINLNLKGSNTLAVHMRRLPFETDSNDMNTRFRYCIDATIQNSLSPLAIVELVHLMRNVAMLHDSRNTFFILALYDMVKDSVLSYLYTQGEKETSIYEKYPTIIPLETIEEMYKKLNSKYLEYLETMEGLTSVHRIADLAVQSPVLGKDEYVPPSISLKIEFTA